MKRKLKLPRGICRECGREFALKATRGDWLCALYPRRHNDSTGKECEGSWIEVEISREPLHDPR